MKTPHDNREITLWDSCRLVYLLEFVPDIIRISKKGFKVVAPECGFLFGGGCLSTHTMTAPLWGCEDDLTPVPLEFLSSYRNETIKVRKEELSCKAVLT